jgi:GNAT superfamily N-acetyltransferase
MSESETESRTASEYVVRPFESGDREPFLDLYETVWGERPAPEWFSWRYQNTPYLTHVPVFVAESADGALVGARPLVPFRMRAGDGDPVVGLHPSNTMVHPDHRRNGLFARMSEACTAFYREREPRFYFNFPNPAALSGNLDFGYRVVGTVPTYYRVQSPAALRGADGRLDRAANAVAGRLARGYLGLRDRVARVDGDVTVGRYAEAPCELLGSLYERRRPDRLHTVRDAEFYRWRLANPERPATVYVAFDGRRPLAALVTYADTADGSDRVKVADVLPVESTPERERALPPLLAVVVREHADADVVVATGEAFPEAPMRAFGFHRDDRFPLDRVAEETTLVVYPLVDGDDGWALDGVALDDAGDWYVTYVDRDTV